MSASLAIYGLLPALVSGYLFNLIFCYTRYPFRRCESQRLFIWSAGVGLFLTFTVFTLINIYKPEILGVLNTVRARRLADITHESLPVEHAASLMLVLMSGPIFAYLGNVVVSIARYVKALLQGVSYMPMRGWMYWRAGTHAPTGSEMLIHEAHREYKLVIINMKSRKVYCGEIIHPPVPDRSGTIGYVKILPKFSAFRNKDTLEIDWSRKIEYPIYEIWLLDGFLSSKKQQLTRASKLLAWQSVFRSAAPRRLSHMVLPNYFHWLKANVLLKKEIEQLEDRIKKLSPFDGFSPKFNDWLKVVSFSEIESISIYYDGISSSWFTSGRDGQASAAEQLLGATACKCG